MTEESFARGAEEESPAIDAALAVMSADELREVIRFILPWLDELTRGRLVNDVIDRAARGSSGWTPEGPSVRTIASITSFAEVAKGDGYADPAQVDDYLRLGSNAFLGKDYQAAREIFRALLLPIGCGDISLGQHEMVDEVLYINVQQCAAQYVVSTYMTTVLGQRAQAVHSALREVSDVAYFRAPISQMELAAVEPLPEMGDFLLRWAALLEERPPIELDDEADDEADDEWDDAGEDTWRDEWNEEEDRWLREVVQRVEGAEGLARVARSTRRTGNLRAWCSALVESSDWKTALSAYEEAADIVTPDAFLCAEFLDGAALAAQELGRRNLPARLERAWRAAPSMARLVRWVGSGASRRAVRKRATQAFADCPQKAHRQRAFLGVLLGKYQLAAELLVEAPGLGWSHDEHPGRLVFQLFNRLLGGDGRDRSAATAPFSSYGADSEDLEWMVSSQDEPRLTTPDPRDVLETAGVEGPANRRIRRIMLGAMRTAAVERAAGITEYKRRRYYGDVAQLVAACAAIDPTPETARWVAALRAEYRRYSALQREFDRHLG